MKYEIIMHDIENIDDALGTADEQVLFNTHLLIDGKYSSFINNWGASMYSYMEQYGFVYDSLHDKESLEHNLRLMKAKLTGYAEHCCDKHEDTTKVAVLKLINKIAEIRGFFKPSGYGPFRTIYSDGNFVEWKNQIVFQLNKLKQDAFILEICALFNQFNGFSDEGRFDEVESKLKILAENIDDYINEENRKNMISVNNKKVFIVHGHNDELLNNIELLIRRIGLDPIILKRESSGGRTIIEKIEHYTNVGFAIILYTSCDEGRLKGTKEFSNRARQNVIFEHGYLCAKLTRSRVVAINEPGIEIPSDLSGVLYIPMSDPNWKQQLMQEMRDAGLEFDPTKS